MDRAEFLALIDRYLAGRASAAEEQLLLNFFESFREGDDWDERVLGAREELEQKMLDRLTRSIRKPVRRQVWYRVAAAASVLLMLSVGAYFMFQPKTAPAVVIVPGSNKAILVLGDGKQINLTDAKNGSLAAGVTKTADGQLVNIATTTIAYNTIRTPNGGQYRVQLPDGTGVWLNAASSLRYPTAFAAERRVELTGEAYFEVAKDATHPFIVHSASQDVQVLGTHFNINTYNDEPAVKTTLLEGKIRIAPAAGTAKILKPGQQAVLTADKLSVAEADTEGAIDWKNGAIDFGEESLEQIMRKVARWYDVEIVYAADVDRTQTFGGAVSRFEQVRKVLSKLELTGGIHFKIEGRRILVTK